jgi:hypothetical protein
LPSECANGTDTSATSQEVTMLLPEAIEDMASLAASLATLSPAETLPALVLGTRARRPFPPAVACML